MLDFGLFAVKIMKFSLTRFSKINVGMGMVVELVWSEIGHSLPRGMRYISNSFKVCPGKRKSALIVVSRLVTSPLTPYFCNFDTFLRSSGSCFKRNL